MNSADTGANSAVADVPGVRVRSNPLLALWRVTLFAGWTAYCYMGCRVSRALSRGALAKRAASAQWTHRWLNTGARLVGVEVIVRGSIPYTGALVTPNHTSYLDIMAIGAAGPTVFVSKADVRSWPILGHLFDMSEHIGVMRSDRRSLTDVNAAIAERLAAGQSVCVFLEGTSFNGTRLLPFHASLAQPAVESATPVVPVGLRWTSALEGVNVAEDIAYWRPEHNIVTHGWRALGLRGTRVVVRFGDPIAPGPDRKALAAQSRQAVLDLLERTDAGE